MSVLKDRINNTAQIMSVAASSPRKARSMVSGSMSHPSALRSRQSDSESEDDDGEAELREELELRREDAFNEKASSCSIRPSDQRGCLQSSSLFLLSGTNPVRLATLMTIRSSLFEGFIILCIVTNCVFMALDDPLSDEEPQYLQIADLVFASIFTAEMVLKIVALGLVLHKGAYLRDPWNVLDGAIVILAWLNFVPGVENFSALRTLRVLRPLRSMNAIPGLKSLVSTVLRSLSGLVNVICLAAFLFLVFGILGVQLWQGAFRFQCVNDETQEVTTVAGCKQDASYYWGHACGTNETCKDVGNPRFGFSNYDNVANAWLLVFQCMTFEAWPSLLRQSYGSFGVISFPVYFALLLFGSFFIPNLALAVISNMYVQERARTEAEVEVLEQQKQNEIQRQRNLNALNVHHTPLHPNPLDVAALRRETSDAETITVLSDSTRHHGTDDSPYHRAISDIGGESGVRSETRKPRTVGTFLSIRRFLHQMTQGYALPETDNRRTADENKNDDDDDVHRRVTPFMAFIIFCIVLNTAVLASQHFQQPDWLDEMTSIVNQVFTFIFLVEMILTMIAQGLPSFVRDGFNLLDFVVVSLSLVEMFVLGSSIVTVFRALRLLRVLKLLKAFPALRGLVLVIVSSMADTLYVVLIMALFLFISALAGTKLFGGKFSQVEQETGEVIRSNFDTLLRAFYTVFHVITTDGWVDVMTVAMKATSPAAAIFFIILVLLGTYLILNLFLSILIDGFRRHGVADVDDVFEAEKDRSRDLQSLVQKENELRLRELHHVSSDESPESSKIARIFSPFANHLQQVPPSLHDLTDPDLHRGRDVCRKCGTVPDEVLPAPPLEEERSIEDVHQPHCFVAHVRRAKYDIIRSLLNFADYHDAMGSAFDFHTSSLLLSQAHLCHLLRHYSVDSFRRLATWKRAKEELHDQMNVIDLAVGEEQIGGAATMAAHGAKPRRIVEMDDNALLCLSPTNTIREFCAEVVKNPVFEAAIIVSVCVSSLTLALDSPLDDPNSTLQQVLNVTNYVFTALFTIEMLLKIIAQGLIAHPGAYLRSGWNVMDAFIVILAIVSILVQAEAVGFVKVLRTLRALRPLRAIRRNRGLRLVFLTLVQSIKGIAHVGLLALLNYTIFGVLAVQLFGGRLYACSDPLVVERSLCNGTFVDPKYGVLPRQWQPLPRNFDNLGSAFLALYQVSSADNWVDIMNSAIDAVSYDEAAKRDNQPLYGLFFIAFFIVGNFFLLNLFVGVLIFNFENVKDKLDGVSLMTEEQKVWVEAQRFMLNFRPEIHLDPLNNALSQHVAAFVKSTQFEIASILAIVANVAVLAMDFYGADDTWENTLSAFNLAFVVLFSVEALLKLVAFGLRYFAVGWNRFDFAIVAISIVSSLITAFVGDSAAAASNVALVRVLRVFRITRVLRLFKQAKQVRVLLETLWFSLPSIGNISIFLLLLFFVYAVLCQQLFAKVPAGIALDNEFFNFQSFLSSMQMMFIFTTNELWSDAMTDCSVQPPFCSNDPSIDNCGSPIAAPILFISFNLVAAFIVSNLVIAVILDNFETTLRIDRSAVTMADLHRFTELWSQMNPDASMMMPTRLLPQLLAQLHPPLGITRKYDRLEIINKLGRFHIRDHEGYVHFVETLIPLSRAVLQVQLTDREERRQQQLWHTAFPELDGLPALRFRERAVHVGHFFCATYIASAYRRSAAIKLVERMREEKRQVVLDALRRQHEMAVANGTEVAVFRGPTPDDLSSTDKQTRTRRRTVVFPE